MSENSHPVTALVCNSNMFVPYVLSEVLNHNEVPYLIMTDIENIRAFFLNMDIPNAKLLFYEQPRSIKHIISAHQRLWKSTKQYNITKVVFFHTEFGGIINKFILKKSKEAEIDFCKVFNSLPFEKAHSLKAFKYKLIDFLFNGVRMDILDQTNMFVPSLPYSFYKQVKARYLSMDIDYDKINHLLSGLLGQDSTNRRIVILTGSNVSSGIIPKDEYISKTNALLDAIGVDACISKCHPRYNDLFGKELELPSIPSWIPGNLIIGNYDVFIGNHSTMIAEAALGGKLAISLLDYYQQSEGMEKQMKAFLEDRLDGKGVIHYPHTVNDILKLIKNKSNGGYKD